MGCKYLSNLLPTACTRTCIPLEEATGISTGKYNLKVKVRVTPAKVKLGKGSFACTVPYPGTSSPDLLT